MTRLARLDHGRDQKIVYLPPMASWKTRTFKPSSPQISKKWQTGRNIKKWDEASLEQDPNRSFGMEKWQRFGRSSGPVKTSPISKRNKIEPKSSKDDISMMHYLAYSLLCKYDIIGCIIGTYIKT